MGDSEKEGKRKKEMAHFNQPILLFSLSLNSLAAEFHSVHQLYFAVIKSFWEISQAKHQQQEQQIVILCRQALLAKVVMAAAAWSGLII